MSSSQGGTSTIDKIKEDLDLFLTNIESKLRGPFSSLDLSKAVTTAALRKTMTPPEYLENLNQVLLRTDKVSQLRILIGLLGLEPEIELDQKVLQVLTTAQEDSDEPWVKAIAGLIQGIMFRTEDDNSRQSCRGKYAEMRLNKTANDVCERVLKCMRETKELNGGKYPADYNAHYIPFRYSMVSEALREKAQVEPFSNPHFTVNWDADILKVDENLEAQRAKEAQEHVPIQLPTSTAASKAAAAAVPPGATNLPAGFKPANLIKKATTKPSSSLFLTRPNPAAKKAQLAGRGSQLVRRKGGAQSLIAGTSYKARTAMTAKTASTTPVAASSAAPTKLGESNAAPRGRFATSKSKMKMLDVDTVSNLHQQSVERKKEEALSKMSKKRRIMEAAKLQGLKRSKPNEEGTPAADPTPAASNATENAAAEPPEESSSPARTPAEPTRTPVASVSAPAPTSAQQQQQHEHEWELLLRERSNKLSDDDRLRVQQFFENQYNPTPDQPVYKMKLHEQRSVDPATGKSIKETFYLELDYEKNASKQSKKIKRY